MPIHKPAKAKRIILLFEINQKDHLNITTTQRMELSVNTSFFGQNEFMLVLRSLYVYSDLQQNRQGIKSGEKSEIMEQSRSSLETES
jgi:hypothetical protein